MNIQPVILSGGAGTRLWPLSRELFPKQLHAPFGGESTLLQHTVMRLRGLDEHQVLPPILVCNEEHRFLVAEQMRQIETDMNGLLLEPTGKNTAPALTLAALHVNAAVGDQVMLVMSADHVIRDVAAFQGVVCEGAARASAGDTVTFGVTPTFAATGYGYIERSSSVAASGVCAVAGFVEKPDEDKARQFFEDPNYLWNSGIFMMTSAVWLEQIKRLREDIYDVCLEAYEKGSSDGLFQRVDKVTFDACPSDSIDYAVMEHLVSDATIDDDSKLLVIPMDAGWSDVGGWSNLQEEAPHDENGNAIQGDVLTYKVKDSLLLSSHRLVAGVGIENLIVVETADAVLVANKDDAQDVKYIVEQLKLQSRSEHQTHKRVHRPWGDYEGIDIGERYQVKRITVKPGASLSLQMHHHRAEHWIVVNGAARVTRGDDVFLLSENESTYIPVGVKHRLENPGQVPLEIIEVQSGSYLGEDDIVRFDDVYGR